MVFGVAIVRLKKRYFNTNYGGYAEDRSIDEYYLIGVGGWVK